MLLGDSRKLIRIDQDSAPYLPEIPKLFNITSECFHISNNAIWTMNHATFPTTPSEQWITWHFQQRHLNNESRDISNNAIWTMNYATFPTTSSEQWITRHFQQCHLNNELRDISNNAIWTMNHATFPTMPSEQ